MYKYGHIGLAFIFAAPVAILFNILHGPYWGIALMGLSFVTCKVPDIDNRTSLLVHRGFAHTIWFGIIVSTILSLVLTIILSVGMENIKTGIQVTDLLLQNWTIAVIVFTGLFIGFLSHLFGDIITEAYDYTINPYWPVTNKSYKLGWTKSGAKTWNYGFLVGGVVSILIVIGTAVMF